MAMGAMVRKVVLALLVLAVAIFVIVLTQRQTPMQTQTKASGGEEKDVCDLEAVRRSLPSNVRFGDRVVIEEAQPAPSPNSQQIQPEQSVPPRTYMERWTVMKAKYKKGDCLIEFSTTDDDQKLLSGLRGYVLIRNGQIVDQIVASMK